MKVGTDGVLLGAWAHGGRQVLDVGTGSGLVALIMAQRYGSAMVTAVELDPDAATQATDNAASSPFASRIRVVETAIQTFAEGQYDAIVSNPPYYDDSLTSPDHGRTVARHTTTLSYRDLFRHVARLLTTDGEFSAIIPANCRSAFDAEAAISGLQPRRVCEVRTVWHKPVSRFLLSYSLRSADVIERSAITIHAADGGYSEEYKTLVGELVER